MSWQQRMPRRARAWGAIPDDGGLSGGLGIALAVLVVLGIVAFIVVKFVA